ncbi:hypothetical protein DRP05_02825 [Archaeoglobales archaeon]|nr:MAG: hypothetical protein DRP05_02825 [Archaeoglobales archaeon]
MVSKFKMLLKPKIISDDRAVSPVAGFAIILLTITAAYTYYQVMIIPGICSAYESKHFAQLEDDFILLTAKIKDAILEGKSTSVIVKLGARYPEIPFFSTPSEFSGTLQSYEAEVRIQNAVGLEEDIKTVWDGNEVVWTGSSLRYIPNYAFSDEGYVVYEYGVVAAGKNSYSSLEGEFINGRTIFIPLLKVEVSESSSSNAEYTFHVFSGGGMGISVTDNGNPIKIILKTSLPENFWREYLNGLNSSYISDVSYSNGYVTITLSRGVIYRLFAGAVSLENERAEQHYLYRITSKVQTVPAELAVEVRDIFNNPVPCAEVTFRSNSTLTDGENTAKTLTVKSDARGVAAVVAKDVTGSDVVVASITRQDSTPYEVAFTVYG